MALVRPSSYSSSSHALRVRLALCAVGGLFVLALFYAALGMQIDPFWFLLAAPIPPLVLFLMRKVPAVFLATMLYLGNFKTHPAVGFSMSDPTVIAVALLYAVVALEMLFSISGTDNRSLQDLFAGQMHGVTAFLVLVLVIAASYLYTPAPAVGAMKVLKLVAIDTLVFLSPLILIRGNREVRHLVLLCLALSSVLAGRALYFLVRPPAALMSSAEDPTRIGDGLLIGIAAMMVLYYPLTRKRNLVLRVMLVTYLIFLTVGLSASVSRTDVFSLLLAMTAAAFLLPQSTTLLSRRESLLTVAIIILSIIVAIHWLQHLSGAHSRVMQKLSELSAISQGSTPGGTAGQRVSFAESALNAFTEKPLLGWGAGGWSTLYHMSDERVLLHPHNFFLEIAAEQGIVGLAALGLVWIAVVRAFASIVKARTNSGLIFIIPISMLCFFYGTTSGQVEDRVMWFWCGAVFAFARLATPRASSSTRRVSSRNSCGKDPAELAG